MRKQSISRKIVLAYSFLVTLAAGLLTSGLYWQLRTVQRQEMRDRLLELLRLATPQIDSDYLALTVTADNMKEPFYKINLERLQNIQTASPSIHHIYTLRQQSNGQLVFVLDLATKDRPSAAVGEPLKSSTPVLQAGIANLHEPTVEPDILKNSEGLPVLYGYAPIKNQFGRTNGLLAIELNARSIIQSEIQVGAIALTILCVVLLLTLIVIWWLAQSLVVRPVLQLNQASKQLANGEWGQTLPTDRIDELGELATSFNHMAGQLKESFETLEQRVQERTQELNQKNHQLQTTLKELHRTQAQMVQTEKMSALGQLVAGIAHEINNPISFIHGNLSHIHQHAQDLLHLLNAYQYHYPHPPESLLTELENVEVDFLKEDLPNILKSMKAGSERVREIVLSLRNFSRLDESEYKAVNLHEGLDNTLMILQHRFKAQAERSAIEIVKQYGEIPLVECCARDLNQVFMNLLVNAIDALEESNRHRSSQKITSQQNRISISTVLTEQNQVKIIIADNGIGIPDNIRDRLFDPFFTTKPVGKGTGLGLAIARQIVTEKHGGSLNVNSTPGQGTEFLITFPTQAEKNS